MNFSKKKKTESSSAEATKTVDPARPETLSKGRHSKETIALYEKSLQDYYAYRSKGLEHRRSVFEWQLFSAKIIFIIVILLVAIGILFAAIQFKQGISKQNDASSDLSTELELSTQSVRINSPVLGVIILFISLGFFYLYLVHIYPIENIF